MNIMRKSLLTLAFVSFFSASLFAQKPIPPMPGRSTVYHPVAKRPGQLLIPVPVPNIYPPLRTDMPLNILIGYIGLDSLSHAVARDTTWEAHVASMGFSDTMRNYLKYLYLMSDYDPVNFHEYLYLGPTGGKGMIEDALLTQTEKAIPDSGSRLASLTGVDAIVHVYVNDTQQVWYGAEEAIHAHCTIIDPIKGQILPSCKSDFRKANGGGKGANALAAKGDCFEFEYGIRAQQKIQDQGGMFTMSRAVPWVTPGNEFIVFVQYSYIGGDSTGRYFRCSPMLKCSSLLGMYPVRNGILFDPNDDFRFGNGLTPDAFKTKLRSSIYTILHP